jgi:hypothetical protein
MQYTELNCSQCGELMEGRANKKFCSAACRAQHFRDNQAGPDNWTEPTKPALSGYHPVEVQQVPLLPTRPRPVFRDDEDEDEDNSLQGLHNRVAKVFDARREADANRKLDEQYTQFVNECLKADGEAFNDEDDDELRTWLDEVDELIIAYRAHTGFHHLDNRAHERLEDLHWLRDKFRRMLTKWQRQETSWGSEPEPVYFELSEKRVAIMRKHLKL